MVEKRCKKNASVVFATQSLSDIDGSAIAPAIIEELPDAALSTERTGDRTADSAIYRRFGLNDRQIEILARATPKRDYYAIAAGQSGSLNWASAKSRSPFARRLEPTRRSSTASSANTAATPSSRAIYFTRAFVGDRLFPHLDWKGSSIMINIRRLADGERALSPSPSQFRRPAQFLVFDPELRAERHHRREH